jgi:hypothetical protein
MVAALKGIPDWRRPNDDPRAWLGHGESRQILKELSPMLGPNFRILGRLLPGLPGVIGTDPSRRVAPDATRAAIAAVLEVSTDRFEVDT